MKKNDVSILYVTRQGLRDFCFHYTDAEGSHVINMGDSYKQSDDRPKY